MVWNGGESFVYIQGTRQRGRSQEDKRVHALWCWVPFCSSPSCPLATGWPCFDGEMVPNAGAESSALGDSCIVMGRRRDCRNRPSINDTPSRDYNINISDIMIRYCQVMYPLHICLELCQSMVLDPFCEPPPKTRYNARFCDLKRFTAQDQRIRDDPRSNGGKHT